MNRLQKNCLDCSGNSELIVLEEKRIYEVIGTYKYSFRSITEPAC